MQFKIIAIDYWYYETYLYINYGYLLNEYQKTMQTPIISLYCQRGSWRGAKRFQTPFENVLYHIFI